MLSSCTLFTHAHTGGGLGNLMIIPIGTNAKNCHNIHLRCNDCEGVWWYFRVFHNFCNFCIIICEIVWWFIKLFQSLAPKMGQLWKVMRASWKWGGTLYLSKKFIFMWQVLFSKNLGHLWLELRQLCFYVTIVVSIATIVIPSQLLLYFYSIFFKLQKGYW